MKSFTAAAAALILLGAGSTAFAAAAPDPANPDDWKVLYPLEYYSSLGSADDLDDPEDPNFGYGHGSQAKFMGKSIMNAQRSGGQNATCFSCKSARFNDMEKEYGSDVFSGTKSTKYGAMMRTEDFWSCTTCHSDMKRPAASSGRQIITPAIFGPELFSKLPPKAAVCAQCHNNLAPWSDSRIIVSNAAIKKGKTAYRYGWDPDAMIRATLEDASPAGVRYPEGKTYEMSKSAGAKTDKNLGIYLIANGSHADAELFMGSVHYKMNVGCADCHMPVMEDKTGKKYRSHDSSKSVLNSKASMQYCLSCHKTESIKTVGDMANFVRAAQKKLGEKDIAVAKALDKTFELLKKAAETKGFDKARLEKAKLNYATASYYKEYVYGNRGATPGEKVAHNPELAPKYLEKALSLLEETDKLLQN